MRRRIMQDRLVWQAASLLLAYPDNGHSDRLDTVEQLLAHITRDSRRLIGETLAALRQIDPMRAAIEYVETFDLKKQSTMYLTYWTAGDTRNRGAAMLTFATAYRTAGAMPPENEAPDHLPVLLEFAAIVDPDSGRRLLTDHRVSIAALREALIDAGSPYAPTVSAICTTLPGADDVGRVRRLMIAGPPAEAVGLQPFQLTVPPRRVQAGS